MKTTNTASPLSFSRLATLVISYYFAPPDGIALYRFLRPLVRTDIILLFESAAKSAV